MSRIGYTQRTPPQIFVTEQPVAFSTAAAISVPPATTHSRRLSAAKSAVVTRIHRIHIRLPEPRPHYQRCQPSYFEAARMSREMDRL